MPKFSDVSIAIRRIAAALALVAGLGGAGRAETITIGLQQSGTAAWETAAMQARHIDRDHGLTIDIRPVADSRAAQTALQTGAVDLILSDYFWVALQRQNGADFTFYPHSLAVGGLMVPSGGVVQNLADLKGARLAVAGGPLDKSYLILQALYAARTGGVLSADARITFGAAPLVFEQLGAGQVDATLNFWHFNTRAAQAGAQEILSVRQMLAGLGIAPPPPLLGWVFSETTAVQRPKDVAAFLAASAATKQALLTDDSLWDQIRPVMNTPDDALFAALRESYRAGIVAGFDAAGIASATKTFEIIAPFGGLDLTGGQATIAPGTFWTGHD